MLKIINRLKPFFEDNYREISVREYSRIMKISPPSASKFLKEMEKEGILIKSINRIYMFFRTNRKSKVFIYLSRIYWSAKIKKSGLLDFLEEKLLNPTIVLFGSTTKAEFHEKSDIDIAIFSISNKKDLNLKKFENKLGREIQLFLFENINSVKNKHLANNMLEGQILLGNWTTWNGLNAGKRRSLKQQK